MCCKSVREVPNHFCPNCKAAFVSMAALRVNTQSITICAPWTSRIVYLMNDNVQF